MSPLAAMRFQISRNGSEMARSSVVRMKSSLEQFSVFCHVLEKRCLLVGEIAHRHAVLLGRLLHFLAMLVRAGQEEDVIPVKPFEPRHAHRLR